MAAIETSVRAAAALDDLYRRHVGDVYRYTYAVLGNHADAEDVTQTTFVNALRALERGEEPQNPSNWLLVIAHNIVRQRWRQAATRPAEVELVYDVPDVEPDDEIELESLVRALQRIPPAQREALVMRELEGRPYSEIAEMLGLTTSALETLLFRARRSLAEELENVVTCQSAELAMSQRLDGRLSRKERRRLDEHLAECAACTKMSQSQARQRKAFKGLAVLPLPIGLALFKDVPAAAAASLPTIGSASSSGAATTGVGTATTAGAGGAATGGGVAVGGSMLGVAAVKVAAVLVAGFVVAGAAYETGKLIRGKPAAPAASQSQQSDVKGAFATRDPRRAQPSASDAAPGGDASAPTTAVSQPSASPAKQIEGIGAGGADEAQSTAAETERGAEEPTQSSSAEQPAEGTGGQEPTGPSGGGQQPSTPSGGGTQQPTTPVGPTTGSTAGGSSGGSDAQPTATSNPSTTSGPAAGAATPPKPKTPKKAKKPKKLTPGGPKSVSGGPKAKSEPKPKNDPKANDQPRGNDQPKGTDQPKADEPKAKDTSGASSDPPAPASEPPTAPAATPEPAGSASAPSSANTGSAGTDNPGNAYGHEKNGKA